MMPRISKTSRPSTPTLSVSKKRKAQQLEDSTSKDLSVSGQITDLTQSSPCLVEQVIVSPRKVAVRRTCPTAPKKKPTLVVSDTKEEIFNGSTESKAAGLTWSEPSISSVKASPSKKLTTQSQSQSLSTIKDCFSLGTLPLMPPQLKRSHAFASSVMDEPVVGSRSGRENTHKCEALGCSRSSFQSPLTCNGSMATTERKCYCSTTLRILQCRSANSSSGWMCISTPSRRKEVSSTLHGDTSLSPAIPSLVPGIYNLIPAASVTHSPDAWTFVLKPLGTLVTGFQTCTSPPMRSRPDSPTPISSSQETLNLSPTDSQKESLLQQELDRLEEEEVAEVKRLLKRAHSMEL